MESMYLITYYGICPYIGDTSMNMLTMELDGYLTSGATELYHVYMLDYKPTMAGNNVIGYTYGIRVPGCTVGEVFCDSNNIIEKITLCDYYDSNGGRFARSLDDAKNSILRKYIGMRIIKIGHSENDTQCSD